MQKIVLSKEQKKRAVQEIREYFARERSEEIGDLASEIILEFIIGKIGPYIYNQAITDVQKYMSEKLEDMDGLMIENDMR